MDCFKKKKYLHFTAYLDRHNSANYLLDNRSFICGSMFGGNSNSVTSIDKEIDDILNYMIENKCVNNEQISLGYLCKEREELFTRFYRNNPNKHLNLFGEMA